MGHRALLALPPLVFLALAVTLYFGMQRDTSNAMSRNMAGQLAPPLPITPVPGTLGLGASLTEGEVTLVNFWASWCPPCRAEHPQLLRLQDQGIRIIGANFNDRAQNAASYLAQDGNPFAATSMDPNGRMTLEWGVIAPPETFIVAADGTILYRYIGPLIGTQYENQFIPALRAAHEDHPSNGAK